ncbi:MULTISPECIES: hypothetical protein [Agrobacterium]|uniref:hypothetical protein n=1 Tax=Agrobacterium TaxID=357 RepID=UPI000DD86C5B|nr:hypothetical protein [Agrobacterium sp. SORGH_AS_0745]MDP9759126.1 hypothetical protein [Agrobacterium tumefaciens]MDQ1223556.1 hypothetical protein [Agrobacterium sp. SORGH_AS_0745]
MLTATRQFVTTGLVALTIAGTALVTASQAEAHNNFGRGLAAGIAGAVVGGTLLAGAGHAHDYGPPEPAPAPYGPPTYVYGPAPVASYYPSCHVVWHQDRSGGMYRTRVCN